MREKVLLTLSATSVLLVGCATSFDNAEPQKAVSPAQEIVISIDLSSLAEEGVSPFKNSWPETFSRKQLGYEVIEVTGAYFVNNKVSDCAISGQRVSQTEHEWSKDLDLIMNKFVSVFCDELGGTEPLAIAGDYFFAKGVLSDLDRRVDDYGGLCGGSAGSGWSTGCALYDSTWSKDLGQARTTGIFAHELFHIVQDNINPGLPQWRIPPGHESYIPVWFIEGSAMVYEFAAIHHLGLDDYFGSIGSSAMLQEEPNTNIDLLSLEEGWSLDTYVVGQIAVEYLVANAGFDPLFEIIVQVGEGSTFSDAFENSVGISLDEFYIKMSRVQLSKM